MSIIDELVNDQDPRSQCRLCAFITSRPKAEQEEWDQALNSMVGQKHRFTHASVHRALQRHEAHVSRGSVENHRSNFHRRDQ